MTLFRTRRDALKMLGAAGAAAMGCGGGSRASNGSLNTGGSGNGGSGGSAAGGTSPGDGGMPLCIVRPAQIEGPFFVDEMLNRSDIRSDPATGVISQGVPLQLVLHVYRIDGNGCIPFAGAMVDVWQCDALGIYSDVVPLNTAGRKFLRGYQFTDQTGTVQFLTIYPGWYPGRTVHLHFKVRTDPASATGFVSQLYFDDAVTDAVAIQAPYNQDTSARLRNQQDSIFLGGGTDLMLNLSPATEGYLASFDIGLRVA